MSAQQLQEKLTQTRSELQSVKAQISGLQRSIQLAQMTKQEVDTEVGGDGNVWQGVGKMFMRSKGRTYTEALESRQADAKEQIDALKKKEAYFAQTLQNLTKAIMEISTA